MPMALDRAHKSLTPSCQKSIAEGHAPPREDPKATLQRAACQRPGKARGNRAEGEGVSDGIRTRDLQGHNLAL